MLPYAYRQQTQSEIARQFGDEFKDPTDAAVFRTFHRNVVNHFGSLRVLKHEEHKKLSGKKKNTYTAAKDPVLIPSWHLEEV